MPTAPWMVSLHGGHSGQFCDHAVGSLAEVLEAAANAGFVAFGISEHAPRLGAQFLYDKEIELGWDVPHLEAMFEDYAHTSRALVETFADRLMIIRGFEAEVVPTANYAEVMLGYREKHQFDFMVGSVHCIDEIFIDGTVPDFERAMKGRGGLEPFSIAYYRAVAQMVEDLQPEVVGHLDLVRKNGHHFGDLDTPPIRKAVTETLEVIRAHDAILDLNTAGLRKGLGTPYPAPWLVTLANDMGVPFCFGDDSHGPAQVGEGIKESRRYLLDNGVHTITALIKEDGAIVRREIPLDG